MKCRPRPLTLIAATALGWMPLFAQSGAAEEHHSLGARVVGEPFVQDLPGVADTVIRITTIAFDPGGAVDAHCHHGSEYGTVTEGTLLVKVGNGDYAPKEKGKVFAVPALTPMYVKNGSDKPAQLISTLVVDKKHAYLTYMSDKDNDCLKK